MTSDSLPFPDDAPLAALDRKTVTDAWARFVDAQDSSLHQVREEIADSWRRSAAAGVSAREHRARHIGDAQAVEDLLKRNEALIDATRSTWELLAENLLQSETLLAVTDANGVILDIHGNPALVRAAVDKHIAVGFDWSESGAGTNAIATALILGRPCVVRTDEHFCESAKIWDCATAPIRDLTDNQVLGVLDIASVGALSSSHALGYAITAAQQIEHALYSAALGRTITLLSWYRNMESRFQAVPTLLLDPKGRVIVANRRVHEVLGCVPERLAIVAGNPVAPDGCSCQIEGTTRYEWSSESTRANEGASWSGGIVVLSSMETDAPSGIHGPVSPEISVPGEFSRIITADPTFLECIDVASRMAKSRAPVLLTGETGSGKELFAAAIHASSDVSGGPFIAVNCGTLSKELAVSELLGYEPGAFTGASPKGHAGKFEQADGGTIFLDEVGELSADVQVHLLRVLQDNVVIRVGGDRERHTRVRVIAATNRNLEAEAEAGRFRMDLYYRLKVLNLGLPPLRRRTGDVPILIDRFIRRLHESYGLGLKAVSPALLGAMQRYHWPGNVRELNGVVERMYILSRSPMLTLQDLPDDIALLLANSPEPNPTDGTGPQLTEIEAEAIRSALSQQDLNLSEIASRLGISRTTLYRRMKSYGIERSRQGLATAR